MDRYEMAIGLIVIAIGSFIAGAACVGIQLEKWKDSVMKLENKWRIWRSMMELKDIEVVAYLLVEKRFGQEFNRLFLLKELKRETYSLK